MTFVKKFKESDEVMTTSEWIEKMGKYYEYVRACQGLPSQGLSKSGVVVNEYMSEQPLHNDKGYVISSKGGGFLHLVDFVDSTGIKHTTNAYWLTRYIDPVIADAKDEKGNTIYDKDERIKRFKERRAKKNASKNR